MLYKSVVNSWKLVQYSWLYFDEYGCMDPTWPFLLMFESRVERNSFCGIETLNGYMYSAG